MERGGGLYEATFLHSFRGAEVNTGIPQSGLRTSTPELEPKFSQVRRRSNLYFYGSTALCSAAFSVCYSYDTR
jgi:hypothetical protein